MKRVALILLTLALLASPGLQESKLFAQSTAFTYQGRLTEGTNAANGRYDLRFTLYDASIGAIQIGPVVTNSTVGVTNGQFSAVLDFGDVFTGAVLWLEVGVRTNGGTSFTT